MVAGREELQAVVTAKDQASQTFKKVSKSGQKMGKSLTQTLGAVKVGALAAVASIAALTAAVRSTINETDRLGKTALRLDIPVEELSKLEFAASQSGSSLRELESGMRRLSRSIVDFKFGLSTAVRPMERLNLTVKDFDGRSLSDSFRLILGRIRELPNPTLQVATALELLGRSGSGFLPMADDLEVLIRKAERLGLVVTKAQADLSAKVVDATDVVGRWVDQLVLLGAEAIVQNMERLTVGVFDFSGRAAAAAEEVRKLKEEAAGLDKIFASLPNLTAPTILPPVLPGTEEALSVAADFRLMAESNLRGFADSVSAGLGGIVDSFTTGWEKARDVTEKKLLDIEIALDVHFENLKIARDESFSEWLDAMERNFREREKAFGRWFRTEERLAEEADNRRVGKQAAREKQAADKIFQQLQRDHERFTNTVVGVFENAFLSAFDAIEQGADVLRSILRSLAQDLGRILLRAGLSGLVGAIFPSPAAGGGGGVATGTPFGLGAPEGGGGRGGFGGGGSPAPSMNVTIVAMDSKGIAETAARNPDAFANVVVQVVASNPKVRTLLSAGLR